MAVSITSCHLARGLFILWAITYLYFYRNLTAAEDRIRRLEEAFAELLPDVNVDEILRSRENGACHSLPQRNPAPAPRPGGVMSASRTSLRDSASPGAEETLPQKPDGFDWVEETTFSSLSDGMAALSMKPEGTGYLGKCFRLCVKIPSLIY